jgi:hypothetical protein
MTVLTQRRSSVAIVVLTLLVVSVDTANAMQRRPASVQPAAVATAQTAGTASVSAGALRVRRTMHRARPHPRRHHNAARPARQNRAGQAVRHDAHAVRRPNRVVAVTSPTGWAPLDAAIARIPSYRPGAAIWLVSNRFGHWGTADWYHATLYIAPDVPVDRLYDVAVHEWSHELSVLDYDGDVATAVKAMNAVFGGSGLDGAERAADCMAKLQGASWTHYTPCLDHDWRRAAARLLAGQRL